MYDITNIIRKPELMDKPNKALSHIEQNEYP